MTPDEYEVSEKYIQVLCERSTTFSKELLKLSEFRYLGVRIYSHNTPQESHACGGGREFSEPEFQNAPSARQLTFQPRHCELI